MKRDIYRKISIVFQLSCHNFILKQRLIMYQTSIDAPYLFCYKMQIDNQKSIRRNKDASIYFYLTKLIIQRIAIIHSVVTVCPNAPNQFHNRVIFVIALKPRRYSDPCRIFAGNLENDFQAL